MVKESLPFCGENSEVFALEEQRIDCQCEASVTINITYRSQTVSMVWQAPDIIQLQEPVALIV